MTYILAYDIGTTGVKTCLFSVGKTIELIASKSHGYPLYVLPDGGAEQDGDDWWNAMAESTRELFAKTTVTPADAVYEPDREKHALYEPYFRTFKKLYKTNTKIYQELAKAKEH